MFCALWILAPDREAGIEASVAGCHLRQVVRDGVVRTSTGALDLVPAVRLRDRGQPGTRPGGLQVAVQR